MSDSSTPTQETYYAGIRFDRNIKGSSPDYGTPTIKYDGVIYPAGQTIEVQDNSTVEFRATPSSGFHLEYWKTTSGTQIQDPDGIYPYFVLGGDAYLYPCYAPTNPTFNKPIYLTTKGAAGTSNVNVSSMNGYYEYSVNTTVAENTVRFNGTGSVGRLPDGKVIRLKARVIDGYSIVFKVDGSVIPTNTLAQQIAGSQTSGIGSESSSTEAGERGSGLSTDSGDDTLVGSWRYADIQPTTGTTRMDLSVEYVADTQTYTVTTSPSPRGCGSASVTVIGSGVSSQSVTVEDGTTVKIVATPAAGYSFENWSSNASERPITTAEYTYQVHSNDNWTAKFTSSDTKITAVSEPTNGGTVNVTDNLNFNQTGTNVSISQSQTQAQMVTLTATANEDYTFQYWYNDNDRSQSIYDERMQVSFGDTDVTWIAKFLYTPQDTVNFKVFTSIDGVHPQYEAGNQNVNFSMSYKDTNGVMTDTIVGPTPQYIESLVETDQTGTYTNIKFGDNSPYYVTENDRTWRYDLTGYKYAVGYISGNSYSQDNVWDPITLVDNQWKLFLNTQGEREHVFTVSGFYTKTETFRVDTSVSTPSGSTSGITVSGSGMYSVGDSVTVRTSTTNTNRFRFECWYDILLDEVVSTDQEYTFIVNENTKLEARYAEYCQIQFSASPNNLGSVGCTQGSSTISSGDYVEYGEDLIFTCIPGSGVSVLNWLDGSVTIPNSSGLTEIQMRVYGNMNIRARLMETSKKLTVRSAGGGIVNVYLKDSGGSYNLIQPDEDTESTYTIPNGNDVRAMAIPSPRYNFESFTLYDSHDAIVETTTSTQLDIIRMVEDMSVSAVFSFVPWVSTLGTIIKVY